jgi:hypothetical protein
LFVIINTNHPTCVASNHLPSSSRNTIVQDDEDGMDIEDQFNPMEEDDTNNTIEDDETIRLI